MLDIYLTDVQKKVQFTDYPGEHPVKFILCTRQISQNPYPIRILLS